MNEEVGLEHELLALEHKLAHFVEPSNMGEVGRLARGRLQVPPVFLFSTFAFVSESDDVDEAKPMFDGQANRCFL